MPPALKLFFVKLFNIKYRITHKKEKTKPKDIDEKQKLRYYKTKQIDTMQNQAKDKKHG